MLVCKKLKWSVFVLIGMSLLVGGLWTRGKSFRLAQEGKKLDPVSQLLHQAAPAPWSRTERDLATLQQLVRDHPKSSRNHTRLGEAYLQKARETGDPGYLTKAETLFQKSLELDRQDFEAMAGMGSLCLSRHNFWEALRWGERGLAINPWSSDLYGIIGDACVELGEYERAIRTFQKMIDLKPQLSSYSRVSYIRELHGDIDGAIQAMQMAVASGAPSRESTAWCQVQLGHLYFNEGNYRLAEQEYQMALKRLPQYVHALAGLARLRMAQNSLEEGLHLYTRVVAAMPLPEYVIALGDLYQVLGKQDLAKQQYDLVRAMHELYRANGVDTEMEMALFKADHELNIAESLEEAKHQIKKQPNIKATDVLAWTLYKAGQYEQAKVAMQQALRLGTKDPLLLYHAGMIYSKAGETGKAKDYLNQALKQNPHFSIRYAPDARRTLDELRSKTPAQCSQLSKG